MWKTVLLAIVLAFATSARAQEFVLAVSEGTSGGLDHAQVINKYQGLADVIGRSISRKVNVVLVREFAQLEDGMKTGRLDFVLARPSDYPARGLSTYGYGFLATARPEGHCVIIAPKGSPVRSVADLRGKRIALPEQAAYMTKFCRAELRDRGIDLARERVQYVREQGAVAFYLQNGFADAGGVASYSGVARKWESDGHVVVHRSVAQPYFPLIASARVSAAQRGAIRKALAAMADTPAERAVLERIGIGAFDLDSEQRLRALLGWLGA